MSVPELPDYEVLRELGRDWMGIVYLARSLRLGRAVAIKFLSAEAASDPKRLDEFRHDARAASALNHPAICTLYDVGESDGRPFLVLEYVEGRTLRSLVDESAPVNRAVTFTRQIAEALRVAHAAGIAHRDIKPENVMVRPDGYVKLLDFGLARLTPPMASPGSFANCKEATSGLLPGGTPSGAEDQNRAESAGGPADIFALGVVAYEMTTGRHPFPAAAESAETYRIEANAPKLLEPLNPVIPRAFDELIVRMLDQDPSSRPTASEVIASLDALAGNHGERTIVPGPTANRRFVGREQERIALWQAFADASAGHGRIVCVTGEPGIGKTSLITEFLHDLSAHNRPHFAARGRCSERLAGADAYRPMLDAIDSLLRGDSGELVGRAVATVAPSWRAQVTPPADAGPAAPEATQERLKREFVAIVRELSKRRPLILFLDDIQWADPSTLDLIAYLGARCDGLHLLAVITYRPTELLLNRRAFLGVQLELQRRAVGRVIPLGMLGREEVDDYLTLAFPGHRFPSEFAGLIHERTEGNPLFVVDLLRYLSDRGAIARGANGWKLTMVVQEVSVDLPESIRSMVRRKLMFIADEDRTLLSIASVQGQEFDSVVTAEAVGQDVAEVEERLQAIDQIHGLVRLTREQELPDRTLALRYAFVHSLYQEELYNGLPASRQLEWSGALARALLAHRADENSARVAEVAYLFETAKEPARAARYFLRAAENAARVSAHVGAVGLAQRGLRLLHDLPDTPERAALELPLQMTLGMQLQVTEGFAAPPVLQAYSRARELCRRSNEVRLMFPVLWGLWLYAKVRSDLSTARELAQEVAALAEQIGDPALTLQSHQAFAVTTLCLGEPAETVACMYRGVALYDRSRHSTHSALYGQDPGVACRAFGAVALWLLGYPDRALRESDAAVRLSHELAEPSTQTLALHFAAMLRQCRREPRPTRILADLQIAIAAEQGFSFWNAGGTVLLGWGMATEGDSTGVSRLRDGLDAWRSTGSVTYLSYFLALLAEAVGLHGRPEEALRITEEGLAIAAQTNEGLFEAELQRLRGDFLLRCNRDSWADAEACYRQALMTASYQKALSLKLRAATSLGRLLRDRGRVGEVRPILADVYGGFTEGHNTSDLRDAKEELELLAQ
jgi:predicted ATPase/predicted Ser/Thr protein kinase